MSRNAAWVLVALWFCCSREAAAQTVGGWRGNGTGVWPAEKPPLTWRRVPQGALADLRSSVSLPQAEELKSASQVAKGQVRQWLVLGPFPSADSASTLDVDPLGGEEKLAPKPGETTAGQTWQVVDLLRPDDPSVFGQPEAPKLDLAAAVGFRQHQVAYAHAYVHSPRGGPVRFVVDHSWGLKAWLNGEEIHRRAERQAVLGTYSGLSQIELQHRTDAASCFTGTLRPGWNRVLLKISTPGPAGHQEMWFNLRMMDPPDVPYESENIAWMTELPARSTGTPIIVGDRLFVMAEPDQLLCLDKRSGQILWTRFVNRYTALDAATRAAQPAYAERVDPLLARLAAERDAIERNKLRLQMDEALAEINPGYFHPPRDGHFDAHFGIVGYTMPTPISDGRRLYVWTGTGVAACFDLAGEQQWATTIDQGELSYTSSAALAEGVFVVFQGHLYGVDAATGKIRWRQPRIHKNIAALLSATLAGQNVVVTQWGDIVRPSDGKLLYRPRNPVANDTGWTPGVVHQDRLFLPNYGVKQLSVLEFRGQSGEDWKPEILCTMNTPDELNHRPNGEWWDRGTAASPVVAGRYAYQVDMYAELCTYDWEAQKVVHHQTLDLDGFSHYNALAVAASPALIDEHLVILDNQGTALVMTTGAAPQVVHKNVIATQLERTLPLPGQETLSYAPPIVDGGRIYLRGERHLYCIGR